MNKIEINCSFCGKGINDVQKIIQGEVESKAEYICDECVFKCTKIIADEAHAMHMSPEETIRWEEYIEAFEELYARSS